MSQSQSTAHKPLGIAALVLGILAFVFSFVPCLGMYAVFPGALGIILGAVAFFLASKADAGKGLIIASVLLSLAGTGVAVYQMITLKKGVESALNDVQHDLDSMNKAAINVADTASTTIDTTMQATIDSMNNAAKPEPAAAH